MKKILLAFAILACATSGRSMALQLDVGVGATRFSAREDGTWWQSRYETNNKLLSSSYKIGVGDLFKGQESKTYRLGWRAAYTYLGKFSGRNHATLWDSEGNQLQDDSKCDYENFSHGCFAWFTGRGNAKGVSLGLTLERDLGPFTVSVEGGMTYFHSRYDTTVELYQGLNSADPAIGRMSAGSTITRQATGNQKTWHTGVRISYSKMYLELVRYNDIFEQGKGADGDVGLTGGPAWQGTVGVMFKF